MSADPPPHTADPVAAVRRFNRFYTRAIGVLEKGYLGTPYTVAEGRVLYEIAKGDGVTAKAVGEITGLDAGYLSRIVARLSATAWSRRARSATMAAAPPAADRPGAASLRRPSTSAPRPGGGHDRRVFGAATARG